MTKIKMTVIWGDVAVDTLNSEGEITKEQAEEYGSVKTYTFKSEEEKEGFERALYEHDGWLSSAIVNKSGKKYHW